jgi:hypothetical protein
MGRTVKRYLRACSFTGLPKMKKYTTSGNKMLSFRPELRLPGAYIVPLG